VTKLGRVNRIGKPVFYCSRAAPAVFYELRVKEGDLIALSEWEVAEPLWMPAVTSRWSATIGLSVTASTVFTTYIEERFRSRPGLMADLSAP
jgi:hypothetical protein